MPYLHCMEAHCVQFVYSHWYLGVIAEQSFEHLQHKSLGIRKNRARHKCSGSQIPDVVQYARIVSFPRLEKACYESKDSRAFCSKALKRRKFSDPCTETPNVLASKLIETLISRTHYSAQFFTCLSVSIYHMCSSFVLCERDSLFISFVCTSFRF